MKSCTNLKQASHPAIQFDFSLGRMCNQREDLEQGRFAAAVAPDNPQHIPRHHVEADIAQYPYVSPFIVAAVVLTRIESTQRRFHFRDNDLAQAVVSSALTETVALAHPPHLDHGQHMDQITSANCRSIRRNEYAAAVSRPATTAVEIASPCQSNGLSKIAARNPSMMPLSGFSMSSHRHC